MASLTSELIGPSRESLTIAEGEVVRLGDDRDVWAKSRRVVEVTKFDDLRDLSLVPEWLSEAETRAAIVADDEEARRIAAGQLPATLGDCGCKGEPTRDELESEAAGAAFSLVPEKRLIAARLRRSYNAIRKVHHPNLARLMSDRGRARYEFDDVLVATVRGWAAAIANANVGIVIHLPIWLFRNVTIGKNATLSMASSEKGLYCHALRIHTGGKLKINGSSFKIRCSTFEGNLS